MLIHWRRSFCTKGQFLGLVKCVVSQENTTYATELIHGLYRNRQHTPAGGSCGRTLLSVDAQDQCQSVLYHSPQLVAIRLELVMDKELFLGSRCHFASCMSGKNDLFDFPFLSDWRCKKECCGNVTAFAFAMLNSHHTL